MSDSRVISGPSADPRTPAGRAALLAVCEAEPVHAIGVNAEQADLARVKRYLTEAVEYIERLEQALDTIAHTGTDCSPAQDPESFYRGQLHRAIGIAARKDGGQ